MSLPLRKKVLRMVSTGMLPADPAAPACLITYARLHDLMLLRNKRKKRFFHFK